MQQKKIGWEKWHNPLRPEPEAEEVAKLSKRLDEDAFPAYKDESDRRLEERGVVPGNLGSCLVGPMGIVPMQEHNDPARVYNFWLMHTNFDIDETVADVLDVATGVEALTIFSRYRARLAFGKMFNDAEVRRWIEKSLCPKQEEKSDNKYLTRVFEHLNSKHSTWAVFEAPDGRLNISTGSEQDVRSEVANHKKNSNQDLIYVSWDQNEKNSRTTSEPRPQD